MTPEEILKGLIDGKYKADQPFEFDDMEKGESEQEVQFNVLDTDNWFLGKIYWSCVLIKGMKGDYLTPDDRDEYILDDIEVMELSFGDGENETEIKDKKIKNLFAKYLSTLWNSGHYEVSVDPKLFKENKNIKSYKNFLLEWGYGGEGGVPSKDPVRVSTKMIDSIRIEDDTEDEDKFTYINDTLDVDLNENVQEDWADPDIYGIPIYLSEDQEKVYRDGTPLKRPWIGKNLVLIEKKGKYYILGEIRYGSGDWFMFYEDIDSIERKKFKEFNGDIKRELNDTEKEKVLDTFSHMKYMSRNLMDDSIPYIKIINDFINEGLVRNIFKKKNKFVEEPHSNVDPLGEEDWDEDTLDNFIYQKLDFRKIQINDQYDARVREYIIYMSLSENRHLDSTKCIAIGKEINWTIIDAYVGSVEKNDLIPYTTLIGQICQDSKPIKDQGDDYETDLFYIGNIPSYKLKSCGRVVDDEIRSKIYEYVNKYTGKNVFIQKITKKLSETVNENKRYDRNEDDWRDLEQEDEIDEDTIISDYIQWKKEGKSLYDFLKQLNDEIINTLLEYYGNKEEMNAIIDRLENMILQYHHDRKPGLLDAENVNAIVDDIADEIDYNNDDYDDYDDLDDEGRYGYCGECGKEMYFEYVDEGDYECTKCGTILEDEDN